MTQHNPPEQERPGHPAWCISDTDDGKHVSEMTLHAAVSDVLVYTRMVGADPQLPGLQVVVTELDGEEAAVVDLPPEQVHDHNALKAAMEAELAILLSPAQGDGQVPE